MTNDFFFGLLISIPMYAITIYLFRDIIIHRFFGGLIMKQVPIENLPAEESYDIRELLTEDVLMDILSSYKLLLIIKYELEFLRDEIATTGSSKKIFIEKLKYIDETVERTEELLKERGKQDDYLVIKSEVQSMFFSIGDGNE